MQTRDIETKIFTEIDKFIFWISLAGAFVLSLIYFDIAGWNRQNLSNFLLSLIINLLTLLIAFAVGYAFLRRIRDIRADSERVILVDAVADRLRPSLTTSHYPASICYEVFDRIPWHELFSNSSRVDIVVHYFDTWINNNFNILQDFFNRGGMIRLILPNYQNPSLVKIIKERFTEFTEDEITTKIRQTSTRLNKILENSKHKSADLTTYYIDEMILYCGIRFDDRILSLSMYEHIRELRVANPGFVIPLNQYPGVRKWFDMEFNGLAKHIDFRKS